MGVTFHERQRLCRHHYTHDRHTGLNATRANIRVKRSQIRDSRVLYKVPREAPTQHGQRAAGGAVQPSRTADAKSDKMLVRYHDPFTEQQGANMTSTVNLRRKGGVLVLGWAISRPAFGGLAPGRRRANVRDIYSSSSSAAAAGAATATGLGWRAAILARLASLWLDRCERCPPPQ